MVEGFATLLTLIGLFPCVQALMGTETCVLTKALSTLVTMIGLLPGVDAIVSNEAALPTEGFPTVFTLIGCLLCMHHLMFKEVGALPKGFPTLTVIGPVHQVCSVMKGKVGAVAESLPTLGAHIRLLPSVCSAVFSEV